MIKNFSQKKKRHKYPKNEKNSDNVLKFSTLRIIIKAPIIMRFYRKGVNMKTVNNDFFEISVNCLAKELPILRKMVGLTQKDLGEILGVSRQTITNIESGTSKMKWSLFLAAMFVFSLDQTTSEYLKTRDIPYQQLKEWLHEKHREVR